MELDLYCTEPHPARIGEIARQTRAAGFAGLWVTEAAHNQGRTSAWEPTHSRLRPNVVGAASATC